MTAGKQTHIDFDRARQLGAIRNAVIPPVRVAEGGRDVLVKSMPLKAILKTIDDHGRGREAWLSFPTLATESGCSERTAKRAVQGLQTLSLICVRTPRSKREAACNHYTIVWSELELLRGAMATDQSAMATDQSAMATDQSAICGTLRAQKRTRTATPTPRFVPDTRQAGMDEDWAAAELALERAGVDFVASTKRLAQQREMTAAEVLHLVETYEEQAEMFASPGAIRVRIREGAWPVPGVQDPRVIREAREAQAAARRKREADAAREAAEFQASGDEAQALEVAYGAELDALDDVQLDELARATFRSEFEWERFRRNRQSCRYQLLVAIHAHRANQPEAEPRRVRVGKTLVRDGRLLLIDSEG